jgi:hypothetical protein
LPLSESPVSEAAGGVGGDGGFGGSLGAVHGDCPGAGGAEDTGSAGGAELGGLTE